MTGWTLYACCASGRGTWSAPEGASPLLKTGPTLEASLAPPPPDFGSALHEAAHLVAAICLGGRAIKATICGQPLAHTEVTGAREKIAVALAGSIGEMAARRIIRRPTDAEILPFLARVETGEAGACDMCRAATMASMLAPAGDTEAALAAFRAVEAATIAMMTQRTVRLAIIRVADAVARDGEIAGDAALAICCEFGVAGEFQINPWRTT